MRKEAAWIVCLGGEDWWYHSHAHFDIQVMKRLSHRIRVLYVCSIAMRMPSLRRDALFWTRIRRKINSVRRRLQQVDKRLWVYSPLPIPLYGYSWGRALNRAVLQAQLYTTFGQLRVHRPLIWVNTPTAWPVVRNRACSGLVYQRTDDYAAYDFDNFNAAYVRSLDDELVRRSDLVLHVSDQLHRQACKLTANALLVPQGVDERFFDRDAAALPPSDLVALRRPVVGYVGSMDAHKFDSKLVSDVAKGMPDVSFVLVGVEDPNAALLRQLPNVHFLGPKLHSQIPAYVHHFDMCMLPTARTTWGLQCRPIKLVEYLAAGRPVVSTVTPAAHQFSAFITMSDDPDAWQASIRAHCTGIVPEGASSVVSCHAWDRVVELITDELAERRLLNTNGKR